MKQGPDDTNPPEPAPRAPRVKAAEPVPAPAVVPGPGAPVTASVTPPVDPHAPAGLAMLRPGFGHTPEDDVAFALGFPHVRRVVDGRKDDENPQASALKILPQIERPHQIEWPRRTAQGLVRVWGLRAIWEISPNARDLRVEAEEALWKDIAIDRSEAFDLLSCRLERDVAGLSERVIENFVLLLEALTSTELVATTIVDILEGFDTDLLLAQWSMPPLVTFHLGYLLLRAPAGVAAALRARLRKMLEAVYEERPVLRRRGFSGQGASHARSIHLVLNGGAAAEDTDRTLRWYTHVVDDPVLVRMRVALNRLAYTPDARLVFLGGNDVLERYAKDWRKLATQDEQLWFLEQHAPMRVPQILPIFLDMLGESLVRAETEAWFDAHRDFARPFVEESVNTTGTRGTTARKLLKRWA